MNGFPLFEGIIVIVALIYTLLLSRKIRNIKLKLNDISEVLDDIAQGNSNRKILANPMI